MATVACDRGQERACRNHRSCRRLPGSAKSEEVSGRLWHRGTRARVARTRTVGFKSEACSLAVRSEADDGIDTWYTKERGVKAV
eukprot:4818406-Prymnesium_polylepis.1